jgi:hypothetical protein
MIKSILLFLFLLSATFAIAQNNVLLLQKKGKTQQSFFPGHYISIKTKQGNFADGLITRIHQDTIYIHHFDIQQEVTAYGGVYFDTAFRYTTAINVNDIGALVLTRAVLKNRSNGTLLLIAGGGVMALGAINGLYRKEPAREWYKPSSYISAGVLVGLGVWLKRPGKNMLRTGKKYSFKILPLGTR